MSHPLISQVHDSRTQDRDAPVSNETTGAQLTGLAKWEHGTSPAGLTNVDQPVRVVNGDDDTMLPTISSFHLAQLLPDDAQLSTQSLRALEKDIRTWVNMWNDNPRPFT